MQLNSYGLNRSSYYLSCLLFLFSLFGAQHAQAHEINPVIIDAQLQPDNRIVFNLQLNLEAQLTDIAAKHDNTEEAANADEYNRLRALPPAELNIEAQGWLDDAPGLLQVLSDDSISLRVVELDIPPVGNEQLARNSTLTLTTEQPVTGDWALGWDNALGTVAFRFSTPDAQDVVTAFLQNGDASATVNMSDLVQISAFGAFINYIPVGYTHIVPLGLDHILFVIGLFLLSTHWKPLLWQISAFTLAHTLTLALGMLGIIRISASVIEPLIALSIVYVAVENILFRSMRWWRPLLVFSFGLLHGLGFASVLTDFGLTTQSFIAGLIGFNLGVELGQLSVIAGCFLLVGIWFSKREFYRSWVVIPGSAAIALTGLFWFVERVSG